MNMTNLVSQAEFSRLAGYARSYVTQLKQAGRLVMEGKKVMVTESLARIEATKDPNRDDVRARHAQAKTEPPPAPPEEPSSTGNYQEARATKEKYLALQAKADYELSIHKLVEAVDVRMAGADIGTALRSAMENLPDQLAPELSVCDDTVKIHALLVEQIERVLHEVSDKVSNLEINSE